MLSDGVDASTVYEQLYTDHAGAVLTYLTNRLRDPDAAEDVAQNTWLKAHRFLPDVLSRGDTAGKPWLMRIATNAMVDHFRAASVRPQTQGIDTAVRPGSGVVPASLMDWQTPETSFLSGTEQGAMRGMVGVLLLALRRDDREVLWWYEYGHRSYAELARRFERTVSSIKSTLYRARQHLDAMVASEMAARRTRSGGIVGRFTNLTDRRGGPDACWPWMGCTNRGHGEWSPVMRLGGTNGRLVTVRRIAYAMHHGALPPWVYPIATCGAPGPASCVNPAHLVGARKGGGGVALSGGCYVPLDPSLLAPEAFDDQHLVARRMALGITALELAALVGVRPPNIYQAENGRARWRRGPELVQRIVAALDRLEREQREHSA